LSDVLMLLLILTADLGGWMVYGHGVAVRPVMEQQHEAAEAHQHGGGAADHHFMPPDSDAQTGITPAAPVTAPSMPSDEAPADVQVGKIHVHGDGSQHHHAH